ncbi:MAG TPA: Rieske 2Fe-2S domain-containing protein [Propylenella sp.]|nr:Rieske 2Fe-2S domain-containing protein [Propylenella sp.]
MMATQLETSSPATSWEPPRPAADRNYPMNCWWVAALAEEVTQDLLGRWLCDTPVLLYRREDGTATAIEDRCPHRSAPLHLGCRKGDNVQCGYHGFTFAPDGSCVSVPSMKVPPPSLRIRSFPVIESYPFVWVYLGDPARIGDVPAPHTLEWASDAAFAEVHGRIDIAANYMLLKENVLDLTHFGFVHAKSFKITDWVDAPRLTGEGEICGYRQSFSSSPLPPVFAEPMGLPAGTPYDRENYGSFLTPALQIAAVDLIDPATKEVTGRFRVSHATTPIDQTHMHYFWVGGRDYGTSPAEMAEFKALTEVGFAEDETMIEAVQKLQLRDPRPTHLLE